MEITFGDGLNGIQGPTKPLIVSVAVSRGNGPNKRLLLQRRYVEDRYWGVWELPQGHVETGETVLGAAKRELLEETGLDLLEATLHYSCDSREDIVVESIMPLCAVLTSGDLSFFSICVTCEATGIAQNQPTEANDNHQWMTLGEITDLLINENVFPLNRPMLKAWCNIV